MTRLELGVKISLGFIPNETPADYRERQTRGRYSTSDLHLLFHEVHTYGAQVSTTRSVGHRRHKSTDAPPHRDGCGLPRLRS
jgi:hypothetical protein